MPLTEKGEKILENMKENYGSPKGEQVFYASRNKGTIKGVDRSCTGTDAIITRTPVVGGWSFDFQRKQEK